MKTVDDVVGGLYPVLPSTWAPDADELSGLSACVLLYWEFPTAEEA